MMPFSPSPRRLLDLLLVIGALVVAAGLLLWSVGEIRGKPFVIPALDGGVPSILRASLLGSVLEGGGRKIGEVRGTPVYLFSEEDFEQGFAAPAGAYVFLKVPSDARGLMSVVFGGLSAQESRFFFYRFTEDLQEAQRARQGQKNVFVGDFGISSGEREASGGRYDHRDTHGPDMVGGRLYFLSRLKETPVVPFPVGNDSDGDYFNARQEADIGTDPHNPDTDGDMLMDGEEAWIREGSDPLRADTDDDGMMDGAIFFANLNPNTRGEWLRCEGGMAGENPFVQKDGLPVACLHY